MILNKTQYDAIMALPPLKLGRHLSSHQRGLMRDIAAVFNDEFKWVEILRPTLRRCLHALVSANQQENATLSRLSILLNW